GAELLTLVKAQLAASAEPKMRVGQENVFEVHWRMRLQARLELLDRLIGRPPARAADEGDYPPDSRLLAVGNAVLLLRLRVFCGLHYCCLFHFPPPGSGLLACTPILPVTPRDHGFALSRGWGVRTVVYPRPVVLPKHMKYV